MNDAHGAAEPSVSRLDNIAGKYMATRAAVRPTSLWTYFVLDAASAHKLPVVTDGTPSFPSRPTAGYATNFACGGIQ